jgi:hypothetical protein
MPRTKHVDLPEVSREWDLQQILFHPKEPPKSCPMCGALYGVDPCDPSRHPSDSDLKKSVNRRTLEELV